MCKETTCSFTGHRIISNERKFQLKQQLEETVFSLIQQGFTTFLSGGALGFDQLAAEAVLCCKESFPEIRLVMVLPCKNQDKFWSRKQQDAYRQILSGADAVIYTADTYHSGCMQQRNRYLVDASGCLLAYLTQDSGGTKNTVKYAEKTGVPVFYLETPDPKQMSFF